MPCFSIYNLNSVLSVLLKRCICDAHHLGPSKQKLDEFYCCLDLSSIFLPPPLPHKCWDERLRKTKSHSTITWDFSYCKGISFYSCPNLQFMNRVIKLSLANLPLLNRTCNIPAYHFWWLWPDPHRSSLNQSVRQDHHTPLHKYPICRWRGMTGR